MERDAMTSTTPMGSSENRIDPMAKTNHPSNLRAARPIPGASTMKLNKLLRIGSWSIGTMTAKSLEMEHLMKRRNIDIMCLQELKWCNTGNKARFLNVQTKACKLFYHGVTNDRNGVGIVLASKYLDNILKITKISDRLMCIKLVIAKEIWNIVSGYAPQVGCTEQEKEAFWVDFDNLLLSIPGDELVSVNADLNGHVGTTNTDFEECHGGFGYGDRNLAGEEILAKCKAHGLIITNTFFIKNRRHLITYSSGGHNTQIDYQLCRRTMKNRVKDCKVILGESLGKQHRLLVTEYFTRKRASEPAPEPIPKIKWHNIKNESSSNFITTMKEYISDIMALE